MNKPEMILRNWIDLNKLNLNFLSGNPNAIDLIPTIKICWFNLCANPNAIHLIEKNFDKIEWYSLSLNPNAIHLLEKNL